MRLGWGCVELVYGLWGFERWDGVVFAVLSRKVLDLLRGVECGAQALRIDYFVEVSLGGRLFSLLAGLVEASFLRLEAVSRRVENFWCAWLGSRIQVVQLRRVSVHVVRMTSPLWIQVGGSEVGSVLEL